MTNVSKTVSESRVGVAFSPGLAVSDLGGTGSSWRPGLLVHTPMPVHTLVHTPVPTYAPVPSTSAAPAAIAALPNVKTIVPAAAKQSQLATAAGRDNRPTEGPSSRRIPV